MASGNSDVLYKYESMRIKWSRCFEEVRNDHVADSIKTFFRNFHRNHRGFTFVVGELYDGTTHLFVKQSRYRQIKNEIEERVDETLPDVAQFRDVTIIKRRISFQGFQSYRDFGNILKEKNLEVERRRYADARKSVRKLRRTLRADPNALILAFDLEVYEHDHSIILEIGYAMTTLNNPKKMQTFHYIIKENLRYANKDFVPDNRDHFIFGTSKRMSLRKAAAKIQEHIADADFVVTHSGAHDTEFLDSCGVSISGKLMFDTQILATALLPDGPPLYSLKRLLEDLEIKFHEKILHNDGNDAVYTMKVFLTLTQHAL
ncbi:unnamed protein product [Porites lobata]|uniref:Gfd2/YDR514C-like C-terminal domain-containing protein n=1 Tax=Porites lobata TaxID=104759 RepID=A0ABN8MSK0_9CNID|nr:unnamed protein product [Porites lobata]